MASATVEAAIDRAAPAELLPCTLTVRLLYFLRLGTTGFGGPIALVGYMQRDLVEKRRWISRQDYVEGLALAQLAPGPLAAQLAIYLGWVRGGVTGATVVGVAFVLPSFVMVLALSALYLRYGGLAWMRGAFYGIGAAVIAIIARSAYKLVRMTLARDRLLWVLFAVSALVTASTESELVWVFLLCGIAALTVKTMGRLPRPRAALGLAPLWLVTGLHRAAGEGVRRWRDSRRDWGDSGCGLRARPALARRCPHRGHRFGDARHPHLREEGPGAARHPRRGPDWAGVEGRHGALSAMRTILVGTDGPRTPLETGPGPRDRRRGTPSPRTGDWGRARTR